MLKNQLKVLNNETVRIVAIELMEQNNTTSTLEVKKVLRAMGFWAIQTDISARMDEICEQEEWHFTCNGSFRTYFVREEIQYMFRHFTQLDMDTFLEESLFSEN
ncbi:MAG: hypothetical protein AB8G22_10175 [Saprospiraceae bacterium]